MEIVRVRILAPVGDYPLESTAKLGVFLKGDLIGIYYVYLDDDCDALDYVDVNRRYKGARIVQGCLRGFSYNAHSMGEQIAADLAQMGYECEKWVTDPAYDRCLHCLGYSEYKSIDGLTCADRECVRLRVE